MSYSLIITNVFTRNGHRTFTLRWENKDDLDWYDIFRFISSKTNIDEECYKVKVGNNFIKYENICSIPEFKLEDYVYYAEDGSMTKSGLLKTSVNNRSIKRLGYENAIHQW